MSVTDNPATVLGLDPSKTGLGWAVLNENGKLLEYGFIPVTFEEDESGEFKQLAELALKVGELAVKYKPTRVNSERAFSGHNPETAALLNRLCGMIALAVWLAFPAQRVEMRTMATFTWHHKVGLKPDIYPTGKLTAKTKKPKMRHDYKAPAQRLAHRLWPECARADAAPLTEAACDAALIGYAEVLSIPVPFS